MRVHLAVLIGSAYGLEIAIAVTGLVMVVLVMVCSAALGVHQGKRDEERGEERKELHGGEVVSEDG